MGHGKGERGEVSEIVVAHKDRLVRFGFEWFEKFCSDHKCTITVMNAESLSPEEEMTKDLRDKGRPEAICAELENIERKIRLLQQEMDRSRRATNPQNYKYDGTTKKGVRKWSIPRGIR